MAVGANSAHPEWYVEGLVDRYQYLIDEMSRQKAKRLFSAETISFCAVAAVLSFLAIGNLWASCLAVLLVSSVRHFELRQLRYFVAVQMLAIQAEFPDVRENVALPAGERR